MRVLLLSAIIASFSINLAPAQTCTVTGTSPLNWPTNGSGIVCSSGGNAFGKSIIIIPAGFTVIFNDNADTWTGTRIEVYGTLNVAANVTVNSSILVKSGGRMTISGRLQLGTGAGCGFTFVVATGGAVDVGGTGADRLTICGADIFKGGGGCNSCGGTNSGQCAYNGSPYCEPAGGFTGPTGFDEGGFDATLPVTLLYFRAGSESQIVRLEWATSMEEKFRKFIVQRSADGLLFDNIGEVPGKGFDIYDIQSKYAFEDETPILGLNYYRLKAVDLDDSFEYFGVKAVKILGPKTLAVYPNPTSGDAISFRTNFPPAETDRIVLVNQMGVEIFNALTRSVQNNISFHNRLRPGVYMLRYISADTEQSVRVAITNE